MVFKSADLASQLDWPRKTTPKWLFECQNPFTGSKVIDVLWLPIIITFYIDTFPKQLKYERLFYLELNKYQILDFNKKNNILILTSQMDWPRKTTPNWHITYQNPYSGSKVIICKAHIHLPLKMVLPSMISIISSVVLAQILSSSLSLKIGLDISKSITLFLRHPLAQFFSLVIEWIIWYEHSIVNIFDIVLSTQYL